MKCNPSFFIVTFCTNSFDFHASALLHFASFPVDFAQELWEYWMLFYLQQEIAAGGTSYQG